MIGRWHGTGLERDMHWMAAAKSLGLVRKDV